MDYVDSSVTLTSGIPARVTINTFEFSAVETSFEDFPFTIRSNACRSIWINGVEKTLCQKYTDTMQEDCSTLHIYHGSPISYDLGADGILWITPLGHNTGCVLRYDPNLDAIFRLVPLGDNQLEIAAVQTPTIVGDTNSFLSTDTVTVQATLTPVSANVPVKWTVVGLEAASGISGFPKEEIQNTDANGISTFSFSPSDNQAFVNNRRTVWATGARIANDALGFEVIATAQVTGHALESRLSQTALGPLVQDEIDTLRQEYVDFQIAVPDRSVIVPSFGTGYNQGNYSVQVSMDLPGHYDSILSAYRGSTVTLNGQPTSIPQTASIVITSGGGFRNPRKNLAAGSKYPNSRHVYGRALDLAPAAASVLVNGQRIQLGLHEHLYPALATASGGIAEQGATQVPVGDPRENHIHVQW